MSPAKPPGRFPALLLASACLLLTGVVYFSLSTMTLHFPADPGGWSAHVGAYAALMVWFTQIYRGARSAVFLAAALLALGIGLEYLQGYTGYRNFERADMVADAVGIGLGWLLGFWVTRTFRRTNAA
jgi:VanZ family protein